MTLLHSEQGSWGDGGGRSWDLVQGSARGLAGQDFVAKNVAKRVIATSSAFLSLFYSRTLHEISNRDLFESEIRSRSKRIERDVDASKPKPF